MRFYNQRHKFYCGIDLHARKMYVCIIDAQGKTKLHQKTNAQYNPPSFDGKKYHSNSIMKR